MRFIETTIAGVVIVEIEPAIDERGFFARTWCAEQFALHGLNPAIVQCNISFNERSGTLRGMHYQSAPFGEAKIVRCVRGAIFDVVVDLRRDSPTHRQWQAFELSSENRTSLYIGEGIAHGFQTLKDESEVIYQMAAAYRPEAAQGVRWNDPAFAIEWPPAERTISTRDNSYANYR